MVKETYVSEEGQKIISITPKVNGCLSLCLKLSPGWDSACLYMELPAAASARKFISRAWREERNVHIFTAIFNSKRTCCLCGIDI